MSHTAADLLPGEVVDLHECIMWLESIAHEHPDLAEPVATRARRLRRVLMRAFIQPQMQPPGASDD